MIGGEVRTVIRILRRVRRLDVLEPFVVLVREVKLNPEADDAENQRRREAMPTTALRRGVHGRELTRREPTLSSKTVYA